MDSVLCNVAWPCDGLSVASLKVFATKARFGCVVHRAEIKGEWREGVEPWVAPAITDPELVQKIKKEYSK